MEIHSRFDLPLAPADAFALLLDLDAVAPCLPGATLGAAREDGARELAVTVRLGPIKFAYDGTVEIAEQDADARRAVLVGAARERRGGGSAKATIAMTVADGDGDGARVDSVATIELTGRAAQSGRGIVEDVSRRMVDEMARSLAERCAAPAAAAAAAPEPAAGAAPAGADAPGAAASAAPAAISTAAPAAPADAARELRAGRLLASIAWERLRRLLSRLRRR